jgi:hypothetical protein
VDATKKVEKFKEPKKPKLAFSCDYCAMTSNVKGNVKRHERASCRKNPNRKTCRNCKNLGFNKSKGYFCDEIENFINHSINIGMDCGYFDAK